MNLARLWEERLATAQRAFSELNMVCEVEHAARMDAERERDKAHDALDEIRKAVDGATK